MAAMDLCAIPGCGKPSKTRGWCHKHYMRWWYTGDTKTTNAPNGARQKFIDEVALPYQGDDCLIWPYSRDRKGYAACLPYGDRYVRAHRIICELVNGPPPDSVHQASHSCGEGYRGCVNPRHLEWKTPKDNTADKKRHGTAQRGEMMPTAKLTETDVRDIRRLALSMKQVDIARKYGVSRDAVSDIIHRVRWNHVD